MYEYIYTHIKCAHFIPTYYVYPWPHVQMFYCLLVEIYMYTYMHTHKYTILHTYIYAISRRLCMCMHVYVRIYYSHMLCVPFAARPDVLLFACRYISNHAVANSILSDASTSTLAPAPALPNPPPPPRWACAKP